MSSEKSDLHESIVEYYEQTDVSYQHWGGAGAYQIHYGYRDSPDLDHYQTLYRMNEILCDTVNVRQDDYVLDAGCGVGGSSAWIARHRGAKVHGITIPEIQVRKARELASKASLPIEFSRQDYTSTNFPDATFTVVWALESVCHTPEKIEFIREAYRVLKPGGRLVVADYFLVRPEDALSEIARYSLGKWLDGWVMPNLATIAEFSSGLSRTGFRGVGMNDITNNIRSSSEEIYARGKEGYPEDIFEKGRNVKQMKHTEANIFQKVALDLGVWKYCIFHCEK